MENFNLNNYKLTAPKTKEDVLHMLDRSLMLAEQLKQVTKQIFQEEMSEAA